MRLVTFLFLLFTSLISFAQNKINLDEIASGLSIPVDLAFDNENNMYVVEKGGKIKRINFNSNQHDEVLNLTDRVNAGANERGLLGLAFHPDYANNGYVFVNYTGSGGDTRISRFKRINNDGYDIDPSTEKVLMLIDQPFNNHNAGDLNFGVDGYLYIAMGDGGSGGDPQNKSQDAKDRLGKMLRIDVNTETELYLVPSDNPYINAIDTLKEIWAMGLRNPWRFSFDQLTQDMWIADVGQNRWEELNFTPATSTGGENYGWRCYEADQKYDFSECDESTEFTFPVHKYATSSGGEGCSITGGYVSRDTTQKSLYGKYIYGDFCSGNIWYIYKNDNGTYVNEKIYKLSTQELSSFGQDNNGVMYAAALGDGAVYKISEKCSIVANANVIEADSCFDNSGGEVQINVSGSTDYTIRLNQFPFNTLTDLEHGIYEYEVLDNDNGCAFEGTFEMPLVDDTLVIEPGLTWIDACFGAMFPVDLGIDLDSMYIYRNEVYYDKSLTSEYVLTESGGYSFMIFNEGCKTYLKNVYDFGMVPELFPPILTINQDTLIIESPHFVFEIYKNDTLILTTDQKKIFIDINQNAVYKLKATGAFGCSSEFSDPLIISSTINNEISIFKFFPNPASNKLNFNDKIQELRIYTTTGVNLKTIFNVESNLDISFLNDGMYIISAKINDKMNRGLLRVIR